MAYSLNRKIADLTPYQPISGTYNIRLDANESYILPSDDVAAKMRAAAEGVCLNRYPDPLAKDVCNAFAARYGVSPENVTASNGTDEMLFVLMNAFLQKGDRLVTMQSDFSMYAFYGELCEADVLTLPKNSDLTVDVDGVIETLREQRPAMLVFSNPCNPTSLGITRDEVRRIIKASSTLIVLDEAYMDFWDQSLLHEVNDYDNLIILRTCSKAVGMAAARLGFAVANDKLTKAVRACKSPYNVNSVTQALGAVLLSENGFLDDSLGDILAQREYLFNALSGAEGEFTLYKTVTNFVFLKTPRAAEIFEGLKQKGIIVRNFGEYLRITVGSRRENDELLAELLPMLSQKEEI